MIKQDSTMLPIEPVHPQPSLPLETPQPSTNDALKQSLLSPGCCCYTNNTIILHLPMLPPCTKLQIAVSPF